MIYINIYVVDCKFLDLRNDENTHTSLTYVMPLITTITKHLHNGFL